MPKSLHHFDENLLELLHCLLNAQVKVKCRIIGWWHRLIFFAPSWKTTCISCQTPKEMKKYWIRSADLVAGLLRKKLYNSWLCSRKCLCRIVFAVKIMYLQFANPQNTHVMVCTKGQLISKQNYLTSPKKWTKRAQARRNIFKENGDKHIGTDMLWA